MAQAVYSGIGATITVRVQLRDLTVEDRRQLLRDLLHDKEACPGQETMTGDELKETFAALDRFCGWRK
jgi:hypothetical protein